MIFYQKYYPITKEELIKEDNCGRGYNELWSTYEKCREVEVQYCNEIFIKCIITIYDSDNFYGHKTNLRFVLIILVDSNFINNIVSEIDYYFDNYLDNEYEEYLERQKEIWINKRRSKLLKDEE